MSSKFQIYLGKVTKINKDSFSIKNNYFIDAATDPLQFEPNEEAVKKICFMINNGIIK